MTDEQIKIKIAEVCGWEPYAAENVGAAARLFNGSVWYRHAESKTIATPNQLPDYCNDLNAMREAEQKMWSINWELRAEFIYQLAKVINPTDGYRMQEGIDLLDATARQRAEALLKTINQWGGSE